MTLKNAADALEALEQRAGTSVAVGDLIRISTALVNAWRSPSGSEVLRLTDVRRDADGASVLVLTRFEQADPDRHVEG